MLVFNFRTIRSSSVLELWGSTHLYATKSSPKDAPSLVSLAGDIRLNFLSTITECREVTDFGIDDEFPGNPFVFISEVGQHPDFPDQRVLLYHPDGELKFDRRYTLLHNEKGVYHEVNYRKRTKRLFLFNRRDDLERLNLPPSTPEPETSTRASRVFGKQRFIPS